MKPLKGIFLLVFLGFFFFAVVVVCFFSLFFFILVLIKTKIQQFLGSHGKSSPWRIPPQQKLGACPHSSFYTKFPKQDLIGGKLFWWLRGRKKKTWEGTNTNPPRFSMEKGQKRSQKAGIWDLPAPFSWEFRGLSTCAAP